MNRTPAPTTGAEWDALGQQHLAAGGIAQAAAAFERAVALDPGAAICWARLGKVQLAMLLHDAAHASLLRACALRPDVAAWHVLRAFALREQNRADAAIEACAAALRIDPDNLHAGVAAALMLPPIYADRRDLENWRNRFLSGLAQLHARMPAWLRHPRAVLDLEWHNFLLAYQGENDVGPQARYSEFLATLLGAAVPELRAPIARRVGDNAKIRVGFVSADFRVCTVGDYFLRWVTDLPRERFHVSTFHTGRAADARTAEFARGSDAFVQSGGPVDDVARTVRAADLDIVVFPETGSSARGALLANLRLAPIQCAAWGHPVTTGSACVEYFLSCAGMEPADAAAHYRETLLPLPGIGVRYRCPDPAPPATRAEFGLPEGNHLYLCPQSLCKLHPDTDDVLLELLLRDERAVLVFFVATAQGQTRAFAERLQRGMQRRGLPPARQLRFLPRMSHRDFLRVLGVADVMLDPMHWSGGNTTLDALASALPVVTLAGRFMRGRQTAAMLRIVGVEELVARDAGEYVELALRVAGDAAQRARLSARIRAGLPKLFDRPEPIVALADALEGIALP